MGCLCLWAKLSDSPSVNWFTVQNVYAYPGKVIEGKPSIQISLSCLLGWLYFQAYFGCHNTLTLGKSPIKLRQCSGITRDVDWDVKHQFK